MPILSTRNIPLQKWGVDCKAITWDLKVLGRRFGWKTAMATFTGAPEDVSYIRIYKAWGSDKNKFIGKATTYDKHLHAASKLVWQLRTEFPKFNDYCVKLEKGKNAGCALDKYLSKLPQAELDRLQAAALAALRENGEQDIEPTGPVEAANVYAKQPVGHTYCVKHSKKHKKSKKHARPAVVININT